MPSNSNGSTERRGPIHAGGYIRRVSSITFSSSGSPPPISCAAVGGSPRRRSRCSATMRGRDLGVARELVEHERHRRCRRVVAGEQQCHHLVAHLPVAERAAVLVVRVEQQAEHVLAALPARAAAVDLGVDDPVELLRRALHARVRCDAGRAGSARCIRWRRTTAPARTARPRRCPLRGSPSGSSPNSARIADPHRQPPRPAVQVHAAPRRELRQGALGLLAHHVDRRRDPLAVERRQHDLARATVELPVDRQQPVAQQADQVAEVRLAPREVRARGETVM